MSDKFDYDLIIIGAGVGGHGAALHAVACGLKTAIVEDGVMGGTCVNRGCIPSKALLAASGRVREMRAKSHLKALGIDVGEVNFDRGAIANHADNLVLKLRGDLTNSLKKLGVDILQGRGKVAGTQKVSVGEKIYSAKDIIIATGSEPFVPRGVQLDGKTVYTSDQAVRLETLPQWVAIIGSGYIGLEFADVYTALGSEVTMIEALDVLMPGFDPDIAKIAERVLLKPRDIETRTSVFATKITPGSPVKIELTEYQPTHDYALLHEAASAQGIVAVENICDRPATVDYQSIPAAAFTHPEVSFVGLTEPQAKEKGAAEGFKVSTAKSYFKGNSKAIAEGETDGLAKIVYREDTGELLGVHIIGIHASDLIHEASAAIRDRATVQKLATIVHAHPTLSEVLDEAYKRAAHI